MQENPIANFIALSSSKEVHNNEEYQFSIYHCLPENGEFQLLATNGLRYKEQNVNLENKDYKHIELYMSLPAYWKIEQRSWPIKWLNLIAQIPQKNDTWFGVGDTIPAGDPPQELDEKLTANTFIISKPILHANDFATTTEGDNSFQMLSVFPIFQSELDYKIKNSHTMLFKKFEKHDINEQLDLFRTSVYKKRFFGMFG